jgi:hypothetical protein
MTLSRTQFVGNIDQLVGTLIQARALRALIVGRSSHS